MSRLNHHPFGPSVVILALVGPALVAQTASLDIFKAYSGLSGVVEKGKKNLFDRQTGEARAIFNQCLEKIPDHFEAHYYLSQLDYGDQEPQKALMHLEAAERSLIKLDAQVKLALDENKAMDERDLQMVEDKIQNMDNLGITGGCMTSTIAVNKRAISDLQAKGTGIFDTSRSFEIPAAYSFWHGNYLLALGRNPEASAQFLLAIQKDPTHAGAWNNLINLYYVEKKIDLAMDYLAKADAANIAIRDGLRKALLAAGTPQKGALH